MNLGQLRLSAKWHSPEAILRRPPNEWNQLGRPVPGRPRRDLHMESRAKHLRQLQEKRLQAVGCPFCTSSYIPNGESLSLPDGKTAIRSYGSSATAYQTGDSGICPEGLCRNIPSAEYHHLYTAGPRRESEPECLSLPAGHIGHRSAHP